MSAYNDLQAQLFDAFATEAKALDIRRKATEQRAAEVAAEARTSSPPRRRRSTTSSPRPRSCSTELKAEEREALLSPRLGPAAVRRRRPPAAPPPRSATRWPRSAKSYVYGAAGPNAFDCSGLTMMAWAQAGVGLPHSSSAQYGSGPHVAASDLQPGDLVFYYSPISHVGMYIGNGLIVHAANPGAGVRVSGSTRCRTSAPSAPADRSGTTRLTHLAPWPVAARWVARRRSDCRCWSWSPLVTWLLVRPDPYVAPAPSGRAPAARPGRGRAGAAARCEDAVAAGDPDAAAGAGARARTPHAGDLLAAVVDNAEAAAGRGLHAALRRRGRRAWTPDGRWQAAVDATWRVRAASTAAPVHEEVLVGFDGRRRPAPSRSPSFGGGDRRTPLWLTGPVEVRRSRPDAGAGRPRPREADLLAGARRRAPSRSSAACCPRWPGRLVVEVPASEEALDAALAAEPGTYADIAAVSASVDGTLTPGLAGARLRQPGGLRRPRPGRRPGGDEPRGRRTSPPARR